MIYAIYTCVFQCVQPLQGFAKIWWQKRQEVMMPKPATEEAPKIIGNGGGKSQRKRCILIRVATVGSQTRLVYVRVNPSEAPASIC